MHQSADKIIPVTVHVNHLDNPPNRCRSTALRMASQTADSVPYRFFRWGLVPSYLAALMLPCAVTSAAASSLICSLVFADVLLCRLFTPAGGCWG